MYVEEGSRRKKERKNESMLFERRVEGIHSFYNSTSIPFFLTTPSRTNKHHKRQNNLRTQFRSNDDLYAVRREAKRVSSRLLGREKQENGESRSEKSCGLQEQRLPLSTRRWTRILTDAKLSCSSRDR
jgi:hypothetical protein